VGVGGPILTRYPTRDFIFDCFSKSGAEGVYTPHPVPPTPTQSGFYFYIYLIFKEIEGKKKGRNRVGVATCGVGVYWDPPESQQKNL